MKVFDLSKTGTFSHGQRRKNVFHLAEGFKTRMIELPAGGKMPLCKMEKHVIFVVLDGEVTVEMDEKTALLREKHCLITGPASLSMQSEKGVRLLGIQIEAAAGVENAPPDER